MAFSNRGSGRSEGRNTYAHSSFDRNQTNTSDNGLSMGFIALAGALFVFTFSGLMAFNYYTNGAAASIQNPAVAALFASEPEPRARNYPTDGLVPFMMAQKTMMVIKINRTELGLDAIDSELHENCTRKVSKNATEWSEEKGKAIFRVKQGADFLTCSMQHQASRLCESYYRKRLAGRINEYLRAYQYKAAFLKKILGNSTGQTMSFIAQTGNGQKDNPALRGEMAIPIIPEPLGNQIKSLSAMGLIGTSDFSGWFTSTPKVLVPYLENIASPC